MGKEVVRALVFQGSLTIERSMKTRVSFKVIGN